jgi:serine/threonine protein kinase
VLKPATDLVLGGCRLEEPLGRGGVGTVYRAWQLTLEREVAVKVIPVVPSDHALKARFQREAHTAAALAHPHTIPIYGAGEEDELLYIVMRLVEGPDLASLVRCQGPLSPARTVTLIEQVAGALDAAHDAGLVHRDVKPANVLLEDHDGADHAYLSDFGLVRSVAGDTGLTLAGQWLGTLDYIAPEQLNGEPVDRRADVYGLTGVLYTLLTGQLPFPRENAAGIAWAHTYAPTPALGLPSLPAGTTADVARSLTQVLAQGMAKRPDERFATAGGLARAARAALGDSAPSAGRGPDDRHLDPGRRVAFCEATTETSALPTRLNAALPATPQRRASPPSPRSVPHRRRMRGRATLVLALLLAGCAAGALAVALELRASGQHGRGRTITSPPVPPGHGFTAPSPSAAYARYPGAAYTAEYPAGWQVIEAERPIGPYFRTEFASADAQQAVLIDRTPGEMVSPRSKALEVEAATARAAGYQRLAFASLTLHGRPALIWEFMLSGGAGNGVRVDIFENFGGSGYAVLSEGRTLAQALPVARGVAGSLVPR